MAVKVLVVDDAAVIRVSMKTILRKHGFDVIGEAEDGYECVQKYKELKPDVVTMDITMPVMSGIDALKKIRAFDPHAKVIMLSAMGQESMVREAIRSGAKTFIVKPYKEEYVVDTIRKVTAL